MPRVNEATTAYSHGSACFTDETSLSRLAGPLIPPGNRARRKEVTT